MSLKKASKHVDRWNAMISFAGDSFNGLEKELSFEMHPKKSGVLELYEKSYNNNVGSRECPPSPPPPLKKATKK